jgi:hypothetical protein
VRSVVADIDERGTGKAVVKIQWHEELKEITKISQRKAIHELGKVYSTSN